MPRSIPPGLILFLGAAMVHASRADEPASEPSPLTPAVRASLDRISADSLRGHLSFLASDLLEGRGTPSRGLDLAAEYIAAQFRRAGLEPIGDDGYFQTASWKYLAPDPEGFACEFKVDGRSIPVAMDHASGSLGAAVDLPPTAVVKVDASSAEAPKALDPDRLEGRVVMVEFPHPARGDRSAVQRANRARAASLQRMEELKPALIVVVDHHGESATGLRQDMESTTSPTWC